LLAIDENSGDQLGRAPDSKPRLFVRRDAADDPDTTTAQRR
jgi:hypothetical protein